MSYTVGRKGVEVGVCPRLWVLGGVEVGPTLWGRKGGKQRVFTAASPA